MEESDQVPLTLAGARTGRRSAQLSRSRVGRWLWVVLLPLPFLLRQLLAANPAWVENYYTRRIFPALSAPWRFMTNLLPFSLTEMAVLALPIALLVFVFFLVRSGRRRQLGRFLRRSGLVAGWLAACLVWQFMLLHGFNYVREPAAESLGLPVRNRSSAEVGEALLWTSRQAARARLSCQEDDAGVFTLSQSIPVTLQRVEAGYARAGQIWPSLEIAPPARPKPVLLSHAWSYTGITGLYNPIWVEANINIDQPAYLLPASVGHEVAHTLGFAREDEAGFISFLAGTENPDPDYRYSSYADATVRLLNSLAAVDPELYRQTSDQIDAGIWRDIAAANAYWQQFAGPVEKTSTRINHAYLKANLQADGVYSYGRMVDLLLAWYETNRDQGTLPEVKISE